MNDEDHAGFAGLPGGGEVEYDGFVGHVRQARNARAGEVRGHRHPEVPRHADVRDLLLGDPHGGEGPSRWESCRPSPDRGSVSDGSDLAPRPSGTQRGGYYPERRMRWGPCPAAREEIRSGTAASTIAGERGNKKFPTKKRRRRSRKRRGRGSRTERRSARRGRP